MVKKKEKKPEDELRKLFLTNFMATVVRAVIQNRHEEKTLEASIPKEEIRQEKVEIFQEEQVPVKREVIQEKIKPREEVPSMPEKMFPSVVKSEELSSVNVPASPRTVQPIKIQGMQPKPQQENIPRIPVQKIIGPIQSSPFERIRPFISDLSVTSIECPGPGKNIIVRQMGIIRTIPMTLSEKEIDDIIKQVSQRTRIPVIKGVFKAAVENFVITAIVSEFAGTRFYIEKMHAAHYARFPMSR